MTRVTIDPCPPAVPYHGIGSLVLDGDHVRPVTLAPFTRPDGTVVVRLGGLAEWVEIVGVVAVERQGRDG